MSATSATLPSSPVQHRDIRSASKPFKRDKDHSEKWSMGQRPSAGVSIGYAWRPDETEDLNPEYLRGGSERQREKVRPHKQWSQITSEHKSHANQTPKPNARAHNYGVSSGASTGRVLRKIDATLDANDEDNTLSRSLLDLLPTHVNNTNSPIQTAMRSGDESIFYSFDNKGKSPQQNGRAVDLGGLVEQAEKKFRADQTEKIVRDEYAVLDQEGETTILNKKGKKGSPKQRAVKTEASVIATSLEDDDGFELV